MKKAIAFLLVLLVIMSLAATYVMASFTHDHNTLVNSCSGNVYERKYVSCPWQGHYGGGTYHSATCQIHQTFKYTTIECSTYGCTFYHTGDKDYTHLCSAYHTGASMVVDVCPY